MTRTIEVIVSPTGETKLETKGFTGNSCREAGRFIEQALGTRASEQLTPEFYQQQTSHQAAQEGRS